MVDLRVLRPLDTTTILMSVAKTHRAVIIDEGWRTGSFAAEISAQIMEGAFDELDSPVARVCSAEVPVPYAKHMDFLNFVIALDEELKVRIPESDYPKLSTLAGCIELLSAQKTTRSAKRP